MELIDNSKMIVVLNEKDTEIIDHIRTMINGELTLNEIFSMTLENTLYDWEHRLKMSKIDKN